MFALVVRFGFADEAAVAAFDRLAADAIPLIRQHEPGTLSYDPYDVADEALARMFVEVYRDEQAHADHEQQPHTVTFLTQVRALVTSIRVERLTGPTV